MTEVLETGEPFTAEELPVTLPRDGKIEQVFINFSYDPLREADNTISGIIATAVDVTEQVFARKNLEQSEQRFQNLIREASVVLAPSPPELKASSAVVGRRNVIKNKPTIQQS